MAMDCAGRRWTWAALLCAAAGLAAQERAERARALTTPDGDRFLLLPTGGPAVVHWVVVTPAGPTEDPEGLDGLAVAVARAAMAGTASVGSRNRATESDLLVRVEENERRRALLQGAGQELPESLLRSLSIDASQAVAVADRLAWERSLRQLPAMPSHLSRTADATLLSLCAPADAVGKVASLLLLRREEPILRGIFDELRGVRAELAAAAADPWTPLRDEVRALAYGAHPAGRPSVTSVDGFRPLARAQALDTFVRTQRPERAVHVLTGGFEVEPVVEILVSAFAASALSAEPYVPAAPPPPPRARTSRLTDGALAGIAVGLHVPADTDPDAVALAMTWLAGGDESFVSRWLFAQQVRAGSVGHAYPFGAAGNGALALVEVAAEERDAEDRTRTEKLFAEVDAALDAARAGTPLPQELATARATLLAEMTAHRVSPDRLALFLAIRCGLLGMSPANALRRIEAVSDAQVQEVLRRLLSPERRVRVTQERKS
jgi:predicted Zn-dependent peptidase